MSIEKNKKDVVEQVAKSSVQPLAVETFYTREEVKASPSAFGVDGEVLAGALFDVEGDKITRSQVLTAIEKFRTRKV